MTVLESVLRRDRAVVVAALAIVTALAWADLVWLANDMWMGGMDMTGFRMIPAGQGWMMPMSAPWQPIEFGAVFVMWVVMMIGMMMPSVAPMILVYARIGRQAGGEGRRLQRAHGSPSVICYRGPHSRLQRHPLNGRWSVRPF